MALFAIVLLVIGWTATRPASSSVASGITIREPAPQSPAVSPAVSSSTSPSPSAPPDPAPAQVVVHVAGAVRKPGVYHLKPGARNDDALKAAGGATAGANTDAVNLAARVEDGSQLYFPTRREQPEGGASSAPPSSAASGVKKGSPAVAKSAGKSGAKGGKSGKLTAGSKETVNINTASAEELERLPGIGPAMAERVIEFRRENHGFKTAEDLLQVSGIGEKKFAKLQPFVRVR
jgi:competence protein ComEA